MFSDDLRHEAHNLQSEMRAAALMLATAESCTGGLIAALMTEIPGSSDVFDRGFVTYSNLAKEDLLGVNPEFIKVHGAVSEQVARAMAEGALIHSDADIAVSVTGVAGPGGGTAEKPVGLVYIGVSHWGETRVRQYVFNGTRADIKFQTAETALTLIEELIT